MRQSSTRPPAWDAPAGIWWGDVALAAALLVFGLVGTGPATSEEGWAGPPLVSHLLVVAACVPVAVWRRRPLWTFATTGLAVLVYLALGTPHGPILVAELIAVYAVASRCPPRHAVVAFAALLIGAVAAAVARTTLGDGTWIDVATVLAVLAAPTAIGVAVRVRRQAEEDVRDARTQQELMRERLQLAQEVHDVVGHGLTVIAMQAGAALHVLDRDPGRAREALEAIRATSRESLDGLRAELDAMRRDDTGPAPRRPVRGATELATLIEGVRRGGLAVDVEGDALRSELPADVETAVSRIVREALTNVLRHGGPRATARVSLRHAPGALLLEVLDTGSGATGPGDGGATGSGDGTGSACGRGIRGMRARAEALGGTLDAGPRADGGFAVRGRIPLAG